MKYNFYQKAVKLWKNKKFLIFFRFFGQKHLTIDFF